MTDERLEEIAAAYREDGPLDWLFSEYDETMREIAADIDALVAEVRRLRVPPRTTDECVRDAMRAWEGD